MRSGRSHRQDPRHHQRRGSRDILLSRRRPAARGGLRPGRHPGRRPCFARLRRAEEGGRPVEAGRLPLRPGALPRGPEGRQGSSGSCWTCTACSCPGSKGGCPVSGIVWHGKECRATQGPPEPDPRKAERLLRESGRWQIAEAPPKLVLNDHCQVCEFRQRCHDQAVQEDNLSLLGAWGRRRSRGYARKGILTADPAGPHLPPDGKGKRAAPTDATTATTPSRPWRSGTSGSTCSARRNSPTPRCGSTSTSRACPTRGSST